MELYSIKMRASKNDGEKNIHISGAEKIVTEDKIDSVCSALRERAMTHPKGTPDNINIKIEKLNADKIVYLNALPVTTVETSTPEQGWHEVDNLLNKIGLSNSKEILSFMKETYAIRGAMLLDCRTLQQLEPDKERGVRATYMDYDRQIGVIEKTQGSNTHFNEALVLATKVVNHPCIKAEICFSDDPDYVTGYVASKEIGYTRITTLKHKGDSSGGRIFLFDGDDTQVEECIEYLQKQPVIVRRDY